MKLTPYSYCAPRIFKAISKIGKKNYAFFFLTGILIQLDLNQNPLDCVCTDQIFHLTHCLYMTPGCKKREFIAHMSVRC